MELIALFFLSKGGFIFNDIMEELSLSEWKLIYFTKFFSYAQLCFLNNSQTRFLITFLIHEMFMDRYLLGCDL